MDIRDKLDGPLGVLKAIDNIASHVDQDSRVRLAALDIITRKVEAAKAEIEVATKTEVADALAELHALAPEVVEA